MIDEEMECAARRGAMLRIVELFGPTFQGEGAAVGRAAHLLRLAGCNLTCTWCDTPFSWDSERADEERLPRDAASHDLAALLDPRIYDTSAATPAVRRLIVTGGEPLLQAAELVGLVVPLLALGWSVEVETSGTVLPGPLAPLVNQFNVSPKLAHSGVAERARIRLQVLNEFARLSSAWFKFVVEDCSNLDEVADLLGRLSTPVSPDRVFVMAEGTTSSLLLSRSRDLADAVVARGWGLTPRWHALLWDDERGR